jgi:hypothetical protein
MHGDGCSVDASELLHEAECSGLRFADHRTHNLSSSTPMFANARRYRWQRRHPDGNPIRLRAAPRS